jgi:O-antigen ligase
LFINLATFGLLFYMEGLLRTRLLPVMTVLFALVVVAAVPFTDRLPFSIQRSLSFLPVKIDPAARLSAEVSTEWRIQMWREVIHEVPRHLLLGKGYIYTAREAQATAMANRDDNGLSGTELAGDYHNGPLSVILPFGIFGVLGFVWFLVAVWRVLHRNYKYGDAQFLILNRFLYAFFFVRLFEFFFVFGALENHLPLFIGMVGLSISLNGGVARRTVTIVESRARPQSLRFRPAKAVTA